MVSAFGYLSTALVGNLLFNNMFKGEETLVTTPPSDKLRISVVIPARNEEDLLPSALQSLADQKELNGTSLSHDLYEVILLINNTTDRSRQVAESFQRLYPTFRLHIAERSFSKSKAHVGHARRLLMDEACRRLETVGRSDAAILSTDADSQVAANWIACNIAELGAGAQAVGGRTIIPAAEKDVLDSAARDLYEYDHLYRRLVCWIEDRMDPEAHDRWPRHHQHYGVSLAVTPQIYKVVGRLPPRGCFEDLAFYDALMRRDIRLRHSNRVRVFTSARLVGRSRQGLSTLLSYWARHGRNGLRTPVESSAFLERMFGNRQRLRALWLRHRECGELSAKDVCELSASSGIKKSHLAREIRSARFFGMLLERLDFYEASRKMWPDRVRLAPLRNAVEELLGRFKACERDRSRARAHRSDTDRYESLRLETTLAVPENGHAHRLLEVQSQAQARANAPITDDHERLRAY